MGALTVVFALLSLCVTPLPPLVRYRIICGWSWAVIHGARVLCGVRWRVEGIDNLPPKPCVIASRHESAWETVAFQLIFPPQVFVLKRKLLRVPFFGWGLARMSPIAIDRGSPARALRQVIAQGARRLQDGFYVAMFPEGTRLAPGRVGARHLPGAAQLAKQCGVPDRAGGAKQRQIVGQKRLSQNPRRHHRARRARDRNRKRDDQRNRRIRAPLDRIPNRRPRAVKSPPRSRQ